MAAGAAQDSVGAPASDRQLWLVMPGARLPLTLLVALALATLPGPALAQRGRQGPHLGTGGQRGTVPRATEDYRAGPYGLTGLDVVDAVEKGEGRQALAAYELLASEAESRGALTVALRAHSAAAHAARRLGLMQKALREGLRAMEIGRGAPPPQSADATAFGKVPRASGFAAPSKPQWQSDNWTK